MPKPEHDPQHNSAPKPGKNPQLSENSFQSAISEIPSALNKLLRKTVQFPEGGVVALYPEDRQMLNALKALYPQAEFSSQIEADLTQSFDAVVYAPPSFSSLKLLPEQIHAACRLLKPGGRLIFAGHKDSGAERVIKKISELTAAPATLMEKGGGGYRLAEFIVSQPVAAAKLELEKILVAVRGIAFEACTSPEVFSKGGLDAGTRYLLEAVPEQCYQFKRLLDLGCGWGAIGLAAAVKNPSGRVAMTDSSAQAVETAQRNITALKLGERVEAMATNDPSILPAGFDLLLSNPPFHAATGDLLTLFKQALSRLKPGSDAYFIVERTYVGKFIQILDQVRSADAKAEVFSTSSDGTYSVLRLGR